MEPVRVKSFPLARTFDSFDAGVSYARAHPQQPQAGRDAARLKDATFVDAYWTMYDWVLCFDSDLSLRIWIDQAEVKWALKPSQSMLVGEEYYRVGASAFPLIWETTGQSSEMDCSALVAKRRGARFKNLFVNENGLYVYLHGHLILEFFCIERLADGRAIIYVFEDE